MKIDRNMILRYTSIVTFFCAYLEVICDNITNKSICNGTSTLTVGQMLLAHTDKRISISIMGEKVWCDENFTCKPDDVHTDPSNDSIRQLHPVFIAEHTGVRLTIPEQYQYDQVAVYRTTRENFMSCDFDNSSLTLDISGDREMSLTDHLQNGINYFIFKGDNSDIQNCTSGERIAIIVKPSDCLHTNITTVCSHHGDCVSSTKQDTYFCQCCDGYVGQYCEQTIPVISSCENITCQHGGTCIDAPIGNMNTTENLNSAHCECRPFFTGKFCETKMSSCRSNPCQSGVCVEKPPSYQCYCVPGFHGKQCEKEYDECISNPCLYGGTCVDRLDKYSCVCTHGHTGINCETKIDLCQPNPCHFNSSCENTDDGFTCTCPEGLTGSTCDNQINECSSNPCQNQGTCVDLKNGFECICPITFAGIHCEYMMDVFAPPIEGPDGGNHSHNLYVVAGTLSGAIILVLIVLVACYCKMHETYRQLTWRRMRYKKRSLSCPDLESYGTGAATNKHRLSADAIWEATSLCYDNATYDSSQQQSQPIASQRI